jgi:nucleoid-associated protein YgaU
MPDSLTGEKTRLKMTRFTVSASGATTVDSSISFTVMLNPAEIKQSSKITYNKKKAQGKSESQSEFSMIEAETVGFALVLDGTGVVPLGANESRVDVKTQMIQLRKVAYDFDGAIHEPGRVRLLWGTFLFFGRLESMATNYTLFKPNGDPLRAKVDLSFVKTVGKTEEGLTRNTTSPDLTHTVEVRDGDTLPLLCNRIYGDPGYYIEVARLNQLTDFRSLKPGRKLRFPPLV